jgi:class 3 adenylate cyclase
MPVNLDPAQLTMTEIIRLQTLLSEELSRRFETSMALAFSDIVDSTAYFSRFGDGAGRQLQQLHCDLLSKALSSTGGRIVDTAGDGVFACFPGAAAAAEAMTTLLHGISAANEHRSREQQLTVRIGLHWGRVLSDGEQVTGDAVNLCARIAASSEPGQIRLSRELFQELDATHRLLCRRLGPVAFKGVGREIELLGLAWRDPMRFPSRIVIRETGERIELPAQDIVTLGRLKMIEGMHANDIVLELPDAAATRRISRWHCELRRGPGGYMLRAVSSQSTLVDGVPVLAGQDVPIAPGSVVELAGVMTLQFISSALTGDSDDGTSITRNHGPQGSAPA